MKKYLRILGVGAATLLLLTACEGNLFMGLGIGQPGEPNTSKTPENDNEALGLIDEIESYYFSSGGSDEETQEYVGALEDIYNSESSDISSETKQKAAITASRIELDSNDEAKDVINNIVDSIDEIMETEDSGGGEGSEYEFLLGMLPDNEEDFDTAYEGMAAASEHFKAFADELENGEPVDLEGDEAEVAFQAAISLLLTAGNDEDPPLIEYDDDGPYINEDFKENEFDPDKNDTLGAAETVLEWGFPDMADELFGE
ncbi:MAG: hypothetical protein R6V67_01985 [Spirochaetia bacterium]